MSNSMMILISVAIVFAIVVFWGHVFAQMRECQERHGEPFVDRLYRVVCVSKQQVAR